MNPTRPSNPLSTTAILHAPRALRPRQPFVPLPTASALAEDAFEAQLPDFTGPQSARMSPAMSAGSRRRISASPEQLRQVVGTLVGHTQRERSQSDGALKAALQKSWQEFAAEPSRGEVLAAALEAVEERGMTEMLALHVGDPVPQDEAFARGSAGEQALIQEDPAIERLRIPLYQLYMHDDQVAKVEPEKVVRLLQAVIDEVPVPMVHVTRRNFIENGHNRVQVARKLGLEDAWVCRPKAGSQ